MFQRNDGRTPMRLACVLMVIGAISVAPSASHDAAGLAGVTATEPAIQKPAGTGGADSTLADERAPPKRR